MELQSYRYRAVEPTGRIVRGSCEASGDLEARAQVRREGLEILSLRLLSGKRKSKRTRSRIRLHPAERLRLTANLHTLVSSHVPIARGLRLLFDEAESGRVAALLADVKASVDRGLGLTESLARHPAVFPPVYLAMVGAGEGSGALEDAFFDVRQELEWQDEQRRFLRKSLLPPAIVMCGVFGLLLVLILFVVPTFKDLFVDLDIGLPDEARIVFAVSDYLRDSGPSLLLGCLLLAGAGSYCLRYPSFRLALEDLLRRVPVAGRLMDRMALMRLARNLHLLLRNGIALSTSLDQCVGLVGSERLRKAVIEVQQRIRRGSRLAESMRSTGAFPGMIVGLVSAGEESGQLSETLLHIHGSLDREVRERFAHLLNLVTPLVTVALGLVVGGIAVTLLSTLFSLYSAVGK